MTLTPSSAVVASVPAIAIVALAVVPTPPLLLLVASLMVGMIGLLLFLLEVAESPCPVLKLLHGGHLLHGQRRRHHHLLRRHHLLVQLKLLLLLVHARHRLGPLMVTLSGLTVVVVAVRPLLLLHPRPRGLVLQSHGSPEEAHVPHQLHREGDALLVVEAHKGEGLLPLGLPVQGDLDAL